MTWTAEKKKIKNVIKASQDQDGTIDNFYRQALVLIGGHLNTFFNEYAVDNQLTLQQTEQAVSQADLAEWQSIIGSFVQGTDDTELAKRLRYLAAQAGINRRNLINSLVGGLIAGATAKVIASSNKKIDQDYKAGYQFRMRKHPEMNNQTNNVPKYDIESPMWTHSDNMVNNMQNDINNNLKRGIDKAALRHLTKSKGINTIRESNNLASDANKVITQVQRLIRTVSYTMTSKGSIQAITDSDKMNDEDTWIGMQTQPGVCDICLGIAGQQPWVLGEQPNLGPEELGGDTHWNCACQLIEVDHNGNPI